MATREELERLRKLKRLKELEAKAIATTATEPKTTLAASPQEAALETILGIGSQAVAEPVSGIAGLLQAINPFTETTGAETVKAVKDYMTYEPKTLQGQQLQQKVGEMFGAIGEQASKIPAGYAGLAELAAGAPLDVAVERAKRVQASPGEALGEDILRTTGSPEAATAVRAASTLLMEALGLKGVNKVRGANKITGITDDAAKKINEAGIDIDDLSDANIEKIKAKSGEQYQAQVERLKKFEEEGVTPTRGDITQELGQQKTEAFLAEQTGDVGDVMRTQRLAQSRQLRENLESMVDNLGVSDDVGTTVKQALTERKKMLRADRKAAYDDLAEQSQSMDIPVISSDIADAMPSGTDLRVFQRTNPGQAAALDELLTEFGIKAADEGVELGFEIRPLSVSNFEEFRQALNNIAQSDPMGNTGRIVGEVKRALDSTMDDLTDSLVKKGNPNISDAAKTARDAHIALKTEFDPKGLADQLIANKAKSTRPKFEESQVFNKIASRTTSPEEFGAMVESLNQGGAAGKRALNDLKTRSVLDLIDSAYSSGSRKIAGERTFGSSGYQKRFDLMKDKLSQIFTEGEMRRLENINEIAESLRPAGAAVPKGSAGFFLEIMNKAGINALMSKLGPAGVLVADKLDDLSKASRNKKALKKALEIPANQEVIKLVRSYPSLAVVLGIAALTDEEEE